MADFCKDCSIKHFGEDFKELAGLSTPEDTVNKLYANVICEGCGFIQVDHEGVCITEKCLVNHKSKETYYPKSPNANEYDNIEF